MWGNSRDLRKCEGIIEKKKQEWTLTSPSDNPTGSHSNSHTEGPTHSHENKMEASTLFENSEHEIVKNVGVNLDQC